MTKFRSRALPLSMRNCRINAHIVTMWVVNSHITTIDFHNSIFKYFIRVTPPTNNNLPILIASKNLEPPLEP